MDLVFFEIEDYWNVSRIVEQPESWHFARFRFLCLHITEACFTRHLVLESDGRYGLLPH